MKNEQLAKFVQIIKQTLESYGKSVERGKRVTIVSSDGKYYYHSLWLSVKKRSLTLGISDHSLEGESPGWDNDFSTKGQWQNNNDRHSISVPVNLDSDDPISRADAKQKIKKFMSSKVPLLIFWKMEDTFNMKGVFT